MSNRRTKRRAYRTRQSIQPSRYEKTEEQRQRNRIGANLCRALIRANREYHKDHDPPEEDAA